VALAFIVGGALGASLALLFAPEGGRQTRTRLRGLATDARDRSTDLVDDVKDRVEDAIVVGKEIFEEKKAILTAAYQAGKDAMEKERGKLLQER
jgi:gas vesicle protein